MLVSVDDHQHALSAALGPGWRGLSFEQPGPLEREYQIDGSDTTASADRQPAIIAGLRETALYRFDAWLRDESSYSRWEHVRLVDLASNAPIPPGSALPLDFRLDADLRRPEAAARLWLIGPNGASREGLELERDRRNARWLVERGGATEALPRWFFPEQPAPFAAELLNLGGRSAAAAYTLALAALTLAWTIRRAFGQWLRTPYQASLPPISEVVLPVWLGAAALVSVRVYHQLPHILDAVSYTFQAGIFAAGRLALPEPPFVAAFKGPFQVLWQGKLFSQYPPGAPTMYALGGLVGLQWLVGPLACAALIGATSWTAGALYGRACGLVALGLGALSPFILFQSGSFLSHPVAAGLLACALAAFVRGERRWAQPWFALAGALLGLSFLSREVASVLFALPLGARLLYRGRRQELLMLAAGGLPFVGLYLLYNAAQTGSPWVLPRALFDPADRFGFGDGVGFHTRHTLAAGLANTDELLSLLQFDLFGWPPLFTLGLLGVPFLFGRWRAWDGLAAAGALAFVAAYVGYFYHGIALGPRYYFEATPWLLLLASRGAQVLANVAGSRVAAALVLGLLSLNTVWFYLPLELQRRADFSALPDGRSVSLSFVKTGPFGPTLAGVPTPALVLTSDWWLYNSALAALNCPRLPECEVVFALAEGQAEAERLIAQFPGRAVSRTTTSGSQVELSPATAP